MKTYVLKERRTGNIIEITRKELTAGQMKEIWRDGFDIIAIK